MALYRQTATEFAMGANTLDDPAVLPEGVLADLQNGLVDKRGRVRARGGVAAFGGGGTTVGGVAPFEPPRLQKRLLAFHPPYVYHSAVNTAWFQTASGASLVNGIHQAVMGRDLSNRWFAFCATVDSPDTSTSFPASRLLWVDPNDGSYSQMADFRPRVIQFWQGRMWAADSRATDHYPDQLWWSNIFDGTDWSLPGAMNLRIDPAQGGAITALVPAREADPRMYVFKDTGIYQFAVVWGTDGYIPLSSNDLDSTKALVRPLTLGLGCVAPRSAVWVTGQQGNDLFFLSQDGVRSLRRAENDASAGAGGPPLSYKVQSWIDRINWNYARRAAAAVDENTYMLAVPLDGATRNTHVLTKNLLAAPQDGWSLWPLEAETPCVIDYPDRRLFFMGSTTYSETLSGGSTATLAAHVYELSSGNDNLDPSGTNPEKHMVTKAFDLGIGDRRKYWRWAEVSYSMQDGDATLSLYSKRDDDPDWTLVDGVAVSRDDGGLTIPAPLPWTLIKEGNFKRVKFGLEGVDPSYQLSLKVADQGSGRVTVREVEVVAEALPKEWS